MGGVLFFNILLIRRQKIFHEIECILNLNNSQNFRRSLTEGYRITCVIGKIYPSWKENREHILGIIFSKVLTLEKVCL